MRERMEALYAERYRQGVCDCFKDCEATDYNPQCSFLCNRSARIGRRYASMETRVVIIGKEDVSVHTHVGEPASFCEEKNQHYIATKHIVAALLGYGDERDITNYKSRSVFVCGEETLHEEIALTNHYHCAFRTSTNRHGVKTTDIQWANCAALVQAELEILRPHVVVLQAGWSVSRKASAQSRLRGVRQYFREDTWSLEEDAQQCGLYIAENKETHETCYVIGSYHPSFAKWNQETYRLPLQQRIRIVKERLHKT